jgi:2-methylcitrate dehydratase PrpD
VLAAARKVEFEVNEAAAEAFAAREYPATVSVETSTGEFAERVEIPLGDPRRPLSEDAVRTKFLSLAEPVIGKTRATRLVEIVGRLEYVEDVRAVLTTIYAG